MDNFYSRCLLCTCIPALTPHIEIFSEEGRQLQLADKIHKSLNIQIEAELPQNVCHSCMEKLEVTHELVTSSQQARIMLLQIKQHDEKVNQVISESLMKDLVSYPLAIEDGNCMDTTELSMVNRDSTRSADCETSKEETVSEEPTHISLMHFSSKPEILAMLEMKQCSFCSAQMYSKVLEPHLKLHHQSYQEPAELNPMLKCPVCQCTLSSQLMQQHILQQHPPIPNPKLQQDCHYCHIKFSYCDLPQHLDSQHGPNAWTECLHCKKMLRNTTMDLETHLFQDHAGGQLLVCLTCDILYSLTGQEQAHMHTHLNYKYKCPLHSCSPMFDSFASLREHVLTIHPQFEQEMQAELKKETYDILRSVSVETLDTGPDIRSNIQMLDHGDPVICDICNETVKHKYYLIKHKNKVHNLNLSFDCEECGLGYPTFQKVSDHIRGKHTAKEYECTVCTKSFTKKRYSAHLEWHQQFPYGILPSKTSNYTRNSMFCGICKKLVENSKTLIAHINSEHLTVAKNSLSYPFVVCNQKFDSYENLTKHRRTEHAPKLKVIERLHEKCREFGARCDYMSTLSPVCCGICNKHKAKNKFCLLTHINSKHLDVVMEPLPFCCELCDKQFTGHKNWLQHQRNKHIPKVQCKECGKIINQCYMSIHLRIHKKNLDFGAKMAEQITNVPDKPILVNKEVLAQQLASLESINKADRPILVDTLIQSVVLHEESGTKRRYISDTPLCSIRCGICNYNALHKFCLVKHINSKHLDVVGQPLPFCCELCDRQFTNYKCLMGHRTKVHLPKLNCEQCGKLISRYKMPGHLKMHERNSIDMERLNMSMDGFEEMLIPEIEIVEHPIKLETEEKENDFITEHQEAQNAGMEKSNVPMNGVGEISPEIEFVEHPIKLEPEEEEQMDCLPELQNADVKPPFENQLPECQVLLHKLLVCELCCFYTENAAEFSTHQAHLHKIQIKEPPA